VKGITKFIKLPVKEKAMLGEALYRLLQARLMLWVLPFNKVAPRLGKHMLETPVEVQPEYTETVQQVRQSIRRLSRRTPWESACLVQAIAAKKMLNRRGIPSTLYLGVTKDKEQEKGMKAHAWLRSGNIFLTGKEGVNLSAFTVVSMFGSEGEER
jgi:hypothetical protein